MFKRLILCSFFATSLNTYADWSEFTLLGTINNVVFSYRTQDAAETAKGTQVQFRCINLNSMRARVLISDIKFNCYDGSQEDGRLLTKRLKGGETFLFDSLENVCEERGGLENLSVSLDARVRR